MRARALLLAVLTVGLALLTGPVAVAADSGSVTFSATLDGRSLDSIDANEPLKLHPERGVLIDITAHNAGTAAVDVRSVRLDAHVVGLAFFTYTTRVDLTLPPGGDGDRHFLLDLGDLGGQATGLLPAELTLLAPDRSAIAVRRLPVDVRGNARSVYAVFAIGVGAVTLLLLIGLLLRLASHRLPDNRWSRAWRFAIPGAGIGLTLTFTLSALRLVVPSARASTLLFLGAGLLGFVVGYLSPSQDDDAGRDDLDEDDFVSDDLDAREQARYGGGRLDDLLQHDQPRETDAPTQTQTQTQSQAPPPPAWPSG
ncbi:MAG: hypothetical protein JWP11_1861 [Frankiales bacterium]|nr:hypothetical protein [Frankiales bacterium]